MIDQHSVRVVDAARWGVHFVRPLPESYSFAAIPKVIESIFADGGQAPEARLLLGPLAGEYRHIILVFVDAFGWRFLEQYGDRYPFLRRFTNEGRVVKLTSQFPSATTTHITTMHTGLVAGQSPVFEWFQYEPSLDAVIAPLLFAYPGDRARDTLLAAGVAPESIFPASRFYPALGRLGVEAHVFQHQSFTPSPFSDVTCRAARIHPFATFAGALHEVCDLVLNATGRTYSYVYNGDIDFAGHEHGTFSPQFAAEVDAGFSALEVHLYAALQGAARDTLLLVTADHGQVDVEPDRTIFVNQTLPEVSSWLESTRSGRPRAPGGACRDLFLHVRPEYLELARTRLAEHLAGAAEVWRLQDLVAQGFFGSRPPAPAFLERAGNLVILPYDGEAVWWREPGRFNQLHIGVHGGLTRQEMHTELLALPVR